MEMEIISSLLDEQPPKKFNGIFKKKNETLGCATVRLDDNNAVIITQLRLKTVYLESVRGSELQLYDKETGLCVKKIKIDHLSLVVREGFANIEYQAF